MFLSLRSNIPHTQDEPCSHVVTFVFASSVFNVSTSCFCLLLSSCFPPLPCHAFCFAFSPLSLSLFSSLSTCLSPSLFLPLLSVPLSSLQSWCPERMSSAAGSAAGLFSVVARRSTTPRWPTTNALSTCCWRPVRHRPHPHVTPHTLVTRNRHVKCVKGNPSVGSCAEHHDKVSSLDSAPSHQRHST